jgi:hypothetical protein
MPLRVFVSSVSALHEERSALQRQVTRLQEIFVGMEYFGGDPERAALDARLVHESDLYVGLFGPHYGTPDPATGKSYTHLEYEAAYAHRVPCLLYFSPDGPVPNDDRQVQLKRLLRERHTPYTYQSIHDLETQFLIDFVREVRGRLAYKAGLGAAPISFETLHAVTRALLHQQITTVGGGNKYNPSLYIPRAAERNLAEFDGIEQMYVERAAAIAADLRGVANEYRLGPDAIRACGEILPAAQASHDGRLCEATLSRLRAAFYFNEVAAARSAFDRFIRSGGDPTERKLLNSEISGKPFVSTEEYSELPRTLHLIFQARSTDPYAPLGSVEVYRSALRLFPSVLVKDSVILANDLISELAGLADKASRRCLAVVDRAGAGKTNLLCHCAEVLSARHAVVVLGAHAEDGSDPEVWLQRRFESELGGGMANWLPRASTGLSDAHKWLYIFVDGLNETEDVAALARGLERFAGRLTDRRIRLIISCRDLFWDAFHHRLSNQLFGPPLVLHDYGDLEWRDALKTYFSRFMVDAELEPVAERALRNPLMLRFFCEANRNRHLGRVSDIGLADVFEQYLERAAGSIAQRLRLLDTEPVTRLLMDAANQMWQLRQTAVEPAGLGISPDAAASSESIYNMIRSENVLLQETQAGRSRKIVRFVYDEFMEYMLARAWHERLADAADRHGAQLDLLQEVTERAPDFPAALGALSFLDALSTSAGRLLGEAVRVAGPERLLASAGRTMALYLMERMAPAGADSDLTTLLQQMHETAPSEFRDRIARIALRLAQHNPRDPILQGIVRQIVELEGDGDDPAQESAPKSAHPSELKTPVPDRPDSGGWRNLIGRLARSSKKEPPAAAGPLESPPLADSPAKQPAAPLSTAEYVARRDALASAKRNKLARPAGTTSSDGGEFAGFLPPAAHRYSEETKLSAISLLASFARGEDFDLAVRKLGRVDLDAALRALKSIDTANTELVYRTVRSHLKSAQPEYRVYCAWLLRNRCGPEPAEFMLQLLTSSQTRVHRYALSLFQTRQVEPELVEAALRRLTVSPPLKPWHLKNLLFLLGKAESFQAAGDPLRSAVVECLRSYRRHAMASVRVSAYGALLKYSGSINPAALQQEVEQDPDPYVRVTVTLLIGGAS